VLVVRGVRVLGSGLDFRGILISRMTLGSTRQRARCDEVTSAARQVVVDGSSGQGWDRDIILLPKHTLNLGRQINCEGGDDGGRHS